MGLVLLIIVGFPSDQNDFFSGLHFPYDIPTSAPFHHINKPPPQLSTTSTNTGLCGLHFLSEQAAP